MVGHMGYLRAAALVISWLLVKRVAMVKFSVPTLLLLCFLAAFISAQAQELPFAKFCGEQEASCSKTCNDEIEEFKCNAVTGITTSPCTCKSGKTEAAVDPPPTPPSFFDDLEAAASDETSENPAAPAGEPAAPTEVADPAETAAPSSAARTACSVVALGFAAMAILF